MKRTIALFLVIAIPAAASADFGWYTNNTSFGNAAANAGYLLWGTETFEENLATEYGTMPDPLDYGVPSAPLWPNGLEEKMTLQANTLGGYPSQPSPRGTDEALFVVPFGTGMGETSDLVFNNVFNDSLDLVFTGYGGYYAVGFAPSVIFGLNPVTVRVYGMDQTLLGETTAATNIDGSAFIGVVSDVLIGRINVNSPSNGSECADSIQLWVPEPASLLLLGFSALLLRRR